MSSDYIVYESAFLLPTSWWRQRNARFCSRVLYFGLSPTVSIPSSSGDILITSLKSASKQRRVADTVRRSRGPICSLQLSGLAVNSLNSVLNWRSKWEATPSKLNSSRHCAVYLFRCVGLIRQNAWLKSGVKYAGNPSKIPQSQNILEWR